MRALCLFIGIGFYLTSNNCIAESNGRNPDYDTSVGLQNADINDNELTNNCVAEVIRIHQLFEQWFQGSIERTTENYSQVTSAILDDFSQVTPDRRYWEREVLFPKLEQSHGMYSESKPIFRLWIKNPRAIMLKGGNYCLAIYEEWRRLDGVERGYITTAILKRSAEAPSGVKWLHLQETWLPVAEKGIT